MKILLITEKCHPRAEARDGGARLVETLKIAFGRSLDILQFGMTTDSAYFEYPHPFPNRFERRLANAQFIAERIKEVEQRYTHLLFVHVSMQFGLVDIPMADGIEIWTFPMFLTPSYIASGESVPDTYLEQERLTLNMSHQILTPSHLEKRQLVDHYFIPEERIHVIPRGLDSKLYLGKVRSFDQEALKICSIGSIKPQKNTLGLIQQFSAIRERFPDAQLKIIGAVQDSTYAQKVNAEIEHLHIQNSVELTGYIPPNKVSEAIQDAHIHLSRSHCETFGRSIFETLAAGIPNIAKRTENAAAEFLHDLPYVKFIDADHEVLGCP